MGTDDYFDDYPDDYAGELFWPADNAELTGDLYPDNDLP